MTICISWIRKLKRHEELVIATDSRLRSYGSWDCNPKIMTLPRTDCAICFDGDTAYAYPILVQLKTSISNYPPSVKRSQDLYEFKGHLLRVMNDMLKYKSDFEIPKVSFILGGYSWQREDFALWRIYYDGHDKKFTFRPIKYWRGIKGKIKVAFSGDYTEEAKERLIALLKKNGKLENGSLDMEPFEILRDMLREPDINRKYETIGGAPQVIKVYKHMNATPIAVNWKIDNVGVITLFGRPLLSYERSYFPVLDPDTLKIKGSKLNI